MSIVKPADPGLYVKAKGGSALITAAETFPPLVINKIARYNLGMRTVTASYFHAAVDLNGSTSALVELWGAKTVTDSTDPTKTILKWFYIEDSQFELLLSLRPSWSESFDTEGYERMTVLVTAVVGGGVYKYEWAI